MQFRLLTVLCNGMLLSRVLAEQPQGQTPSLKFWEMIHLLQRVMGITVVDLIRRAGKLPPSARSQCSSPAIRLRAFAACAWLAFSMNLQATQWPARYDLEEHNLFAYARGATLAANVCAREGFHPPVIMRVAQWVHALAKRYGEANPRVILLRFACDDLWRAYDEYRDFCIELDARRQAKFVAQPNVYRCAAPGCNIYAVHKSAFRTCGGPCLPENKPRYCSELCQTEVRALHFIMHAYHD